jgi:lipopolysaccharide/colanic/teichoic acid biosynthesis glycosyltransferase
MYPVLKRLFDLVAASIGLVVLSPVFAFLAFRIKSFDGGPVFYVGRRVGRDGVPFGMYKFRTMVLNADKIGGSSTPDDDPASRPSAR